MTREEAKSCIGTIEMLQRLAYNIHGVMDVIDVDNCNKIIKLLEQQPCDDAISRQAAEALFRNARKELMKQDRKEHIKDFNTRDLMLLNAEQFIHLLPSVTPQPKTGRWEWVQYDGNPNIGNWHCSECRTIVPYMPENAKHTPIRKWCPNCGAKMAEPQERDEIACEDFVGGESDAK